MKSWLPWKFFLRHAARRRGFIDPVGFLARLRQFAQPSEVQEPIELIRAGVLFHARGLINTKVLQFNLDWVWPYWVERQFDPDDRSFLPRAFSFSHVNLTHRNWTGLGIPGANQYVIVDPRGLVTPHFDGWSLDWWWIPDEGPPLFPSRSLEARQWLDVSRGLEIASAFQSESGSLLTRARVDLDQESGCPRRVLRMSARLHAHESGRLILALRPANPEGVAFVETVETLPDGFRIDGTYSVAFSPGPDAWIGSTYADGDLSNRLRAELEGRKLLKCPSGLAAVGAVFRAGRDAELPIDATLDLGPAPDRLAGVSTTSVWKQALSPVPELNIPEHKWKELHDSALRTLVLLSPGEVYPGFYTYRRFWFRDACLIMHALLAVNLEDRVQGTLELFPRLQRPDGYFHSQHGEWDANGEVLWIANQFERKSDRLLCRRLVKAFDKGADWIVRKRSRTKGGNHTGLLPPGFSAEHLGPNDYYYWDDFWGYAGLLAAADIHGRRGDSRRAASLRAAAADFHSDIARSLDQLPGEVARYGIPASPYRRMDAGAIGSLVADYPLQLEEFGIERLARTADWLWKNQLHQGGFFQDMIHSGVNAYLSLALAQTFLRLGDSRCLDLVQCIADLASPTGNWPEAIHPRTGGGCMGDGQHAWASAEWVMMMRSLFVREHGGRLVIASGIPDSWLESEGPISYGPTCTVWGRVSVRLERHKSYWTISIDARWRGRAPRIEVRLPGHEPISLDSIDGPLRLDPAPRASPRFRPRSFRARSEEATKGF